MVFPESLGASKLTLPSVLGMNTLYTHRPNSSDQDNLSRRNTALKKENCACLEHRSNFFGLALNLLTPFSTAVSQ